MKLNRLHRFNCPACGYSIIPERVVFAIKPPDLNGTNIVKLECKCGIRFAKESDFLEPVEIKTVENINDAGRL